MKISKRSIYMIIVSIYVVTLLCGLETFVISNPIEMTRKALLMGIPFLINLSIILDNIKNLKALKEHKKYLIFVSANIIWYIFTIIFGIKIGIQSVTGLVTITDIIILLFFISRVEYSSDDKKKINNAIMYSALIAVVYGILQYIFKFDLNTYANIKYPGINGRIPGTFFLPTLFDKYLMVIYVLVLAKLLKEKKIMYAIFALLVSTDIILTFTRSGLIVVIIIDFLFIIKTIVDKKYKYILVPILACIIAFLIPGFVYSFQAVLNYGYSKLHLPQNAQISLVHNSDAYEVEDITKDHSLSGRKYFNDIGKQLFREHPVFGIGLNNYSYIYNNQNAALYLKNTDVLTDQEYAYPHNGYIMMAAETGFIGLILFYGYILFIGYDSFKQKNYLPLIVYATFLLGSYTESLTNKQYLLIFAFIYGFLCNVSKEKSKKRSD